MTFSSVGLSASGAFSITAMSPIFAGSPAGLSGSGGSVRLVPLKPRKRNVLHTRAPIPCSQNARPARCPCRCRSRHEGCRIGRAVRDATRQGQRFGPVARPYRGLLGVVRVQGDAAIGEVAGILDRRTGHARPFWSCGVPDRVGPTWIGAIQMECQGLQVFTVRLQLRPVGVLACARPEFATVLDDDRRCPENPCPLMADEVAVSTKMRVLPLTMRTWRK